MSISSANGLDSTNRPFNNFLIARRTSRAIDQFLLSFDFHVCGVQSIPTSVNKFITRRVGGQKVGRGNHREQGTRMAVGFRRQNQETFLSRRRTPRSNSIIGLPDNATRPGLVSGKTENRDASCGDYVSHPSRYAHARAHKRA